MTVAPFNLILDSSIMAKVTAFNFYGPSITSAVGSGANIVLVPNAPVNFANVPSVTKASKIGLSWAISTISGATGG